MNDDWWGRWWYTLNIKWGGGIWGSAFLATIIIQKFTFPSILLSEESGTWKAVEEATRQEQLVIYIFWMIDLLGLLATLSHKPLVCVWVSLFYKKLVHIIALHFYNAFIQDSTSWQPDQSSSGKM